MPLACRPARDFRPFSSCHNWRLRAVVHTAECNTRTTYLDALCRALRDTLLCGENLVSTLFLCKSQYKSFMSKQVTFGVNP
eukprot:COSAG02_NODE_3199_length_7185_cov_9.666949_6_plen_81_part_00